MSRVNFPTAPRLWRRRREDKSPCVRAWERSFLPRSSSYQILPYSGNSMGNESTQESGLTPPPKKEDKHNKEKVIANFRDHAFTGINRNTAEWENGCFTGRYINRQQAGQKCVL